MSRANAPLNFLSYMRHTSQLSRLLTEAGHRGEEQERLRELLPPALRDQVRIQRDQDCLVLTVRNNAVAQLLHFQQPLLLRASGCAQLRIRIGSIDDVIGPADTPLIERQLSASTAQLLLEAADDFEDQALAEVFRRLAEHAH